MKFLPCPASPRATLRADGADLSFVTVTVAGQGGLLVPHSKNARFRDVGWKFSPWIDAGHGKLKLWPASWKPVRDFRVAGAPSSVAMTSRWKIPRPAAVRQHPAAI